MKVTNSQLDTTNESQEVSPFPAGDDKAHISRRAHINSKHKTEINIKGPQKKYHLGSVSKIIYWGAYGIDQESIQSSTTSDPGYHMGKRQKHNETSQTRAKWSALSHQLTTRHQ